MQTRFNFVGNVVIPKADSKRPLVREFNKNGKNMLSMNFGVKESDHNMAFVECFGMEQDVIKTMDTDNNKIEISWKDRFDEDVIKSVASYRKTIVNLGDELGGRKEFISTYDAIEYIKDNIADVKGKVCVTGQMRKDFYQGKVYDKFEMQNIYVVDEDRKPRLGLTVDLYYNKNCVDKADWKSDKIITINGYVQQYISAEKKTMYVPQTVVFNAQKYKEDNEKHQKLLNYKLKYVDISNKKMAHLMWECVLINGAIEVDFDESQLTPSQREQIELGLRTLDDFKPSGLIFGERVVESRLFEPILKGDFADGLVDTEMTESEFEEEVYTPAADEKLEDVVSKAESKAEVDDDDDEDELF